MNRLKPTLLLAIVVMCLCEHSVKSQDSVTGGAEPIARSLDPATLTYDFLVDGNLPADEPATRRFKTLQAAYAAAPVGTRAKPTVIGIKPNVYQLPGPARGPSLSITKNYITLLGLTDKTRWCFVGTPLAGALGADDRVRSALFHGELNGEHGYRFWTNVCGFAWVREYPDVQNAGNDLGGVMGDHRLVAVSVRKIEDMNETAKAVGAPRVMDFHPARDEESGLELCGVTWQEGGTGDAYLSIAILFGIGAGNQGGPAGGMTDYAGCLIRPN